MADDKLDLFHDVYFVLIPSTDLSDEVAAAVGLTLSALLSEPY